MIGQDRTTQTRFKPMGPAALREARRGMRLANELRLPLVSFIDTPGAELSPEAEQGAIAGEIARCITLDVDDAGADRVGAARARAAAAERSRCCRPTS